MSGAWRREPDYDVHVPSVRSALGDLRSALLCRLVGHRYRDYYLLYRDPTEDHLGRVHRECARCGARWWGDPVALGSGYLLRLLDVQARRYLGKPWGEVADHPELVKDRQGLKCVYQHACAVVVVHGLEQARYAACQQV